MSSDINKKVSSIRDIALRIQKNMNAVFPCLCIVSDPSDPDFCVEICARKKILLEVTRLTKDK